MKTVAIVGALDTKGEENQYLKGLLEKMGVKTLLIDVGILHAPSVCPDISAECVAQAMGTDLMALRAKRDRSECLTCMGNGAGKLVRSLCDQGKVHGVISIGGGQGTLMGALVMRQLPLGFPKLLLSTIALLKDSDVPFRGIRDTMVMNSQVDVSGLNSVMKLMLQKSAAALVGMVNMAFDSPVCNSKLCIGMTMFGITTPCVTRARELLEERGYEVLVFHATGTGGPTMESLISEGRIHGVADITLAEITHQLFGGSGAAGDDRLLTAGRYGIPQVVVPGALDCINFMPPESMPERFQGRKYHMHNENLKVVRTSCEENGILGRVIAQRLNRSKGDVEVLLPTLGLSANDCPNGGDFRDDKADEELFRELQTHLSPGISCRRLEYHINDPKFAEKIAETLDRLMRQRYGTCDYVSSD